MKQIIASLQSTNVSFSVFIPFSSGPSVQAAKCSCCTKGWSSFPPRAVRISFSCFPTRDDLRSRRGQMGRRLVLTDARRQDTARNMLLPRLFATDGWWHGATGGFPCCTAHTHSTFSVTTHRYKNKPRTRGNQQLEHMHYDEKCHRNTFSCSYWPLGLWTTQWDNINRKGVKL